jgi:NitT/TauT family transport system ATP-binding protein
MSARPGTIIEEILIDVSDRNDPIARRRNPRVGEYVARLMELLHLGDLAQAEQI